MPESSECVFAKSLSKKDRVVLESTTHSAPIATLLRQNGAHVTISNPFKTKMIAGSKVKTDKIDAETLARLLASDYIPSVWQPSLEIEEFRKIVSFANAVICQRTAIKNRVHSILHRNLVSYSEVPDLFNGKGTKFLKTVSLPEPERFQLNIELQILEETENKLKTIKQRIAGKVIVDEDSKRLMTIPGIDFYTALALKAAIGEISRFYNPKKLASYFGLNPRIYQSAKTCHTGPITKRGRSHARWVIIHAAQHAATTPGPLRSFFRRIKRRTVRNKAIVAVASKLTRVIWNMLTKKEDYRFAHPLRTKEKFSKLRIIATGIRQQSGRIKGVPFKGGRKAYKKARRDDHNNALQGEKHYEKFIKKRTPKASIA